MKGFLSGIIFPASALTVLCAASVMAQTIGSLKLTITDNGSVSDTVRFGEVHGATSGLDVDLGEFELPPVPPSEAFDVRWMVAGVEGLSIDYRDTVNAQNKKDAWTLKFQPSSSGYPVTITWDSTKLWTGFFRMNDASTGGTKLSVDMSAQGRVTITDATIKSLTIIHTFTVTKPVNLQSGWNLVSVPVGVKNWSTAQNFPSYISAYSYASEYQAANTLAHGKGYWVNYPGSATPLLTGEPFASDTFEVLSGWNLIGSTYSTISTSFIQQIPNSIITSYFFSYSNGYKQATSIAPGQGIWVKANQAGQLVLASASLSKASPQDFAGNDTTWNTITFSDAAGGSGELLFSSQASSVDQFDIPPKPPAGVFDVRFSGDRFAGTLPGSSSVLDLQMQSAQAPIRLEWNIRNGKSYLLGGLSATPIALRRRGSAVVDKFNNFAELKAAAGDELSSLPANFELHQNYPNPFNPSTTIRFDLKEQSTVVLEVFNTLGEKIIEQNYGSMNAGTYDEAVDLGGLPSGMYFYRIIVQGSDGEKFASTKKLVLMK